MIIAKGVDVPIGVFDIETLLECFDVGIFDMDTREWTEFQVSKYKNDLFSFVKFYKQNKFKYWVSFNGIGFDHPVLEYVVDNHQDWFDKSNLEICKMISDYAGKIIEDQNYGIAPKYREYNFSVNALDVFRIHHFNNEARRTSLKWCEFMMNMDVEEMPIHHLATGLTEQDIKDVQSYRKNDVIATAALLYITLGELDNVITLIREYFGYEMTLDELKDYIGKNKIQDRFDVEKETGMKCLNWSDVQIGEEWNKLDYKEAEKIKDDKILFNRKVKYPFGQKFKNFFPATMNFQTEHLKTFIKMVGETPVLAMKQEFPITIGSTNYMFAKGGLHSTHKNRVLKAPSGYFLTDEDVGSQYPNAINKLKVYPPHLKETIIKQFSEKIQRRITLKDKGNLLKKEGKKEEARPYMSVQEMLKLCMNGGFFGKLGQEGSFLYYPEGLLKVCIGNQIEILMAIEMMELEGFNVVQANTDGFLTIYPENKQEKFKELCREWELKVGNDLLGKLEAAQFSAVWEDSVNSYIGKKTDGSVKKKGKYMTEFEMNKNKSKRIIALALEAYFIEGKDPIEFITNHKNIFDFCIAKKAFGQLHYEELTGDTVKVHKKLIRYFVSKDGNVFMKRGINNEGDPMNNHCEAEDKDFPWMGQPKLTYFNKAFTPKEFKDYNIDYPYYILETLKRIDNVQKTKLARSYCERFKPQIQTSLF